MILIDKDKLLEALNSMYEYSELGEVIKLVEDWETYHTAIRAGAERPLLIYRGKTIYLTENHIRALREYDTKAIQNEIVNKFYENLEQVQSEDFQIKLKTMEGPKTSQELAELWKKNREEGKE